jgi:hypothetical protein
VIAFIVFVPVPVWVIAPSIAGFLQVRLPTTQNPVAVGVGGAVYVNVGEANPEKLDEPVRVYGLGIVALNPVVVVFKYDEKAKYKLATFTKVEALTVIECPNLHV